MTAAGTRLAELGELIRNRREEIPLTIEEAVKRAGFGSANTWLNLEHGRPVRSMSYAAAERRVLGWNTGACDNYLKTGELPTLVDELPDATPQQMADAINRASDDDLYAMGIERHEIAVVRAVAEKIARKGIPGENGAMRASG